MDFDRKLAIEVATAHLEDFTKAQPELDRLDKWWRWEHDKPHAPRTSTKEYRQLADRAETPWLGLVVTSVAQALAVEGYRSSDGAGDDVWRIWQANGMDSRQSGLHRAALGYGYCYAKVEAGKSFTGDPIPTIRGMSPRRMMAFYEDVAVDDWPMFALQVDSKRLEDPKIGRKALGYEIRLYGDTEYHLLHQYEKQGDLRFITSQRHGAPLCPIVRYANQADLEGRTPGEVEPFIPIAARIDQTTFDRLVVQRFSSWVVRTIAGMAKPDDKDEAEAERLRLKVEDLLIAADADTKFGSLPATPLNGFIEAKDADIRDLAAVSQTPPHHLLGQMANLSADALASAEASLMRKVEERKNSFGESHEQTLRLAALIDGNEGAAADFGSEVRWKDIQSRSLAQVVDALGKMAQMLGVPLEALWTMIPGVTDQMADEWKDLAAADPGVDALMRELLVTPTPAPQTGVG